MKARYHLEYGSVVALAALLRALPRGVALQAGAALGQLGWWLRIRRRLVLSNLAQAFPEATPRERRRIAVRAAHNFGRTVAEFVRFAGSDRERVAELVRLEGVEALREALAVGGGAIVVTAHLGAWALYVTALAAAGIPSALLVGRQHNPKVQRFILGIPGEAVHFVPKSKGAPRDIMRCLRDGRAVVMVADHNAGWRGEFAPFLGKVASTLPLPGAIAARHGTPIFLMAGRRLSRGTHRVEISRLQLPKGDDQERLRHEITVVFNEALGGVILTCPEQYFWYHRRWREYPNVPETMPLG
jgi:Kdo2-lipid IVA lauroyltransferase/acyltransferase